MKYIMYAEKQGEKVLLPLRRVAVSSELRGALSTTDYELTYYNPDGEASLECTYSFPLEKSAVLASFEATIADRVL